MSLLDAGDRMRIALLMVPMLAMALLEMASIGLIIPLIGVMFSRDGNQTDPSTFNTLALQVPGVAEGDASTVAIVFCCVFIGKNILLLTMLYTVNHTVHGMTASFVERLYRNYLERPLTFHLHRNSAEIIRNLTFGAPTTFQALRLLLMIALELILMTAAFLLLAIIDPVITFCVAGTLLVVGALFHRIAAPRFRSWGAQAASYEGELMKLSGQGVRGIRDAKLFQVSSFLSQTLGDIARGLGRLQALSATAIQVPRLLIETVIVIGFAIVIFAMIAQGRAHTEIISLLGVFGMAALRLMPSLNRILSSFADLRHRAAYIDILHQDLIEGRENRDPASYDTSQPLPFERLIHLNHVSYCYPHALKPAVRDIDLTIEKGTSVGFVGPSGAGKTTIIDILLGLLQPNSGWMTVDKNRVSVNPAAWQKKVGFVPQQVHLIDDTLSRNIAFGLPDYAIEEVRVVEAARLAQLAEVVETLPDGLDTVIGEHGARLSGGQRQRIAIARALYHDPDVLIFDEATSALDMDTEREVSRTINRLAGRKTIVLIAHRISTVRNCDHIVYLRDGSIVAQGKFDSLCIENPDFRRFVSSGDADKEII